MFGRGRIVSTPQSTFLIRSWTQSDVRRGKKEVDENKETMIEGLGKRGGNRRCRKQTTYKECNKFGNGENKMGVASYYVKV